MKTDGATSYWAMAIALIASTTAALPAAAQDNGGLVVEEIVVTAQKREQSLQDVPISVTALSENTLRDAGAVDMEAISRLVPSLTTIANDGPASQSYRIRGIGSDPNIPTFEPDVGLFIDGVYLPRSGMGVEDLVDLERVEVLAGPQSTLYGKNVTAGVINVVTQSPSKHFEAHVGASASRIEGAKNAGALRTEGSISGPVSDAVRFRVTGVYYKQGATFKNIVPDAKDANDLQRYALRGIVDIDLSATTRLTLTVARTEIFGTRMQDPDLFYYGDIPFFFDSEFGPLFGVVPCPDNNPKNRVICTDSPYRASSYSNIASATLTSEIGENSLTSITAWSNYGTRYRADDIDQLRIPLVAIDDKQSGKSFSQEIRLASPAGDTIEWLAGAYYLHTSFERGDRGRDPIFTLGEAAILGFGQPGDTGFMDSRAKSDYAAIFGQATYHLGDHFVLTGGLRLQTETKKASIDNSYIIAPGSPFNLIAEALTPTFVNASFKHDTDDVTWQLSGQYHPTKDAMLYLNYARGGKSGGFNIGYGASLPEERPFGDEKVDNYEVGAKWTSPGRRVRLGMAAFHTVYTDYQNAGFVSLQFLVNNAEKATTNGVEANGDFVLARGLTLNAAATYTDAKYDRYTGGSCYPGLAPNNDTGTGCDLSGKSLPLIPDWRANAGLQYERSIGIGDIYGRADLSWSSATMTNTNLDPRHTQDAYGLVNLRLGVRTKGGVDASIWVNNLTDKTYVVQSSVTNLFGDDPAYQSYLGEPREIGITLRKDF